MSKTNDLISHMKSKLSVEDIRLIREIVRDEIREGLAHVENTDSDGWMTLDEFSDMMSVTRQTVHRWAISGTIETKTIGMKRMYKEKPRN